MRVIIAEDSVILREGLVRILTDAGVTVAGGTDDAGRLISLVREHRPDAVLVDIRLPPAFTDEGLRAAREIREHHPDVGVLVLSQYIETGSALQLLFRDPRGFGYLLKERIADISEPTDALKRVAAGESVIDLRVVARLLGRRRVAAVLDELTGREREVLALMAEGRSNEATRRPAARLHHAHRPRKRIQLGPVPFPRRRVGATAEHGPNRVLLR